MSFAPRTSYTIYETVERFVAKASQDFVQIPILKTLPPSQKRLSIMLTGYLTHGERPLVGNLIVTNFQDFIAGHDYPEAKEEFWIFSELEKDDVSPDATLVQRVGAWQAMNREDEVTLRELLQQRKPQQVLVDTAFHLIRQMADRPIAGGVIGKNLIATIVASDPNLPCVSMVKLDNQKDIVTFADSLVLLGPEDSLSAKEVKMMVMDRPDNKLQENVIKKEENKTRKKRRRHKRH